MSFKKSEGEKERLRNWKLFLFINIHNATAEFPYILRFKSDKYHAFVKKKFELIQGNVLIFFLFDRTIYVLQKNNFMK